MSDEPLPMLQGKFEPLKKMSAKQKDIEITAWRNLWSYVPSEVKGVAGLVASLPESPKCIVCFNLP